MAEKDDSRELVLAPNEYATILDKTNGNIYLYVGPKQDSLAQTVQPVYFSDKTKGFERCDLSRATQKTTIAPEGWYVVLKNPSKDGKHPSQGNRSPMPELDTGRKINIPGPVSFAPWPGQMVKVLQGHTLRSNQYVLARVYDQTAARANWKDATIETTETTDDKKGNVLGDVKADQLTMGQMIVIKGTDVSFFIPPTGIEVVADQNGKLVRDAVTLETLDYCLLLDERGEKRFERGPAVIFPEPTEVFLTRTVDGEETRRFRAFELSETSGIYLKVIADYEEAGNHYKQGDELFVTGEDEGAKIYFPRREHSIIKYDGHEIHYATAIPGGEGRYVLDRQKGEVTTVKGPKMYLPDPRKQVFARRILSDRLCALLYPNNNEALSFNRSLKQKADTEAYIALNDSAPIAVAAASARGGFESLMYSSASVSNSAVDRGLASKTAHGFTGDSFERAGRYTEPRSVTLDTKFQGVVTTVLWTNYAINLVKNTGETRVEVGPKTVLVDYDENPQVLKLSTGKPKNMDKVFETPFLMVTGNKVSDYIDVETRDFVKLQLKLSYRVNFEGDPKKWFNVENYVKLLCDHERSRLAAEVKHHGIEMFYENAIEHIREVVLGKKDGDKPRAGTTFAENGMRIYDVEVLEVKILNADIEKVLVSAQREAITQRLDLANRKRLLDHTIENEIITRGLAQAQAETEFARLQLSQETIKRSLEHDLTKTQAEAKAAEEDHIAKMADAKAESEMVSVQIARDKEQAAADHAVKEQDQSLVLAKLTAEVEAVVNKAKAITPDLIAALTAFGDKALIEKLSVSMSPMALLGGTSVTEVIKDLLAGTKLANVLATPPQNGANGGAAKAGSSATA